MCIILILLGIITVLLVLWWIYSTKAMLTKINEKVILITGAGSGFGKAFAARCLDEGVTVFAGCHQQKSVDQLNEELGNKPGHLEAFVLDVTSDDSVNAAVEFVKEKLENTGKKLHAVVNNAGVRGKVFLDSFMSIEDYRQPMEVNTYGAIRVTHAFQPLIKQSKGRLIYCTTAGVMFPAPATTTYTVSKFAITGYAACIRHELLPFDVKVITVQPGIFRTKINELSEVLKETNEVWENAPESAREEYGYYYFGKGKRVYVDVVEMSTTDLTPVVDAYFQAAFAKYPFLNYIVGKDANLIFRPYSWMPTEIQVYITSMLQKFFNAPIPAAIDFTEN